MRKKELVAEVVRLEQLVAEGVQKNSDERHQALSDKFDLLHELDSLVILLPMWFRSDLVEAGFISPRDNWWRVTEAGQDAAHEVGQADAKRMIAAADKFVAERTEEAAERTEEILDQVDDGGADEATK